MKYRKKPVVINAIQFQSDDIKNILNWIEGFGVKYMDVIQYNPHQHIYEVATFEGPFVIRDDDWLIRGVAGEFYPCKPGIFEQTYERVSEGEISTNTK